MMALIKLKDRISSLVRDRFVTLPLTLKLLKDVYGPPQPGRPMKYNQDTFYYWVWKWRWKWDSAILAWTVTDLRAYCPQCKSRLEAYQTSYDTVLMCPNCTEPNTLNNRTSEQPSEIQGHILRKASQQVVLTNR